MDVEGVPTRSDRIGWALREMHEQVASSNGPAVHGTHLALYTEIPWVVIEAIVQDPDFFVGLMDRIRTYTSQGFVGMEAATVDDFPTEFRDRVRTAVLCVKIRNLTDRKTLVPPYAIALLSSGLIITANEMKAHRVINRWPAEDPDTYNWAG